MKHSDPAFLTTADLPQRLRETFKAWGLRSLGDEAADEIDRLRGALAEIAKATDAGAYFTARRIAAATIEGNDHG